MYIVYVYCILYIACIYNIGNTNSKSQQKVTEGTEIHKKTAMKKQKGHDKALKLQIICNNKE